MPASLPGTVRYAPETREEQQESELSLMGPDGAPDAKSKKKKRTPNDPVEAITEERESWDRALAQKKAGGGGSAAAKRCGCCSGRIYHTFCCATLGMSWTMGGLLAWAAPGAGAGVVAVASDCARRADRRGMSTLLLLTRACPDVARLAPRDGGTLRFCRRARRVNSTPFCP